jgi:glycosyltransferase involved in cell wall biosynthesis
LSLGVHVGEFWGGTIEFVAYLIAVPWILKSSDAIKGMPKVVRLDGLDWDIGPVNEASLTVVVPARDEAANIAATLNALMVADYGPLHVLAIDDRSTDATGTIMEQYAERFPARMSVLHITELPEGWLGKTHALMLATEQTDTDYLLFTDADVLFSPSILRRAMTYAEASDADHLVVLPTMQVKSRGEGIVLGFFQIFGLWASRPWKIEDAESRRDVVGVGACGAMR